MKKIEYFIVIFLTLFSFYYTEKAISKIKEKDPLIKMIEEKSKQYNTSYVNGVLEKDTITLGVSGLEIDINSSYEKMKALNTYNENLLEYKKVMPTISKDNNYDKAIIGTSTNEKIISLVFNIDSISDYNNISYILDQNKVSATFFIDGKILNDSISKLNLSNSNFGIYSYNNSFNTTSANYMNRVLSQVNKTNYCLYKDDKFLKTCKSLKIFTIKPVIVDKDIYSFFKNSKEKGKIYQVKITNSNIKELNNALIYLKQKGYKVLNIEKMLEE